MSQTAALDEVVKRAVQAAFYRSEHAPQLSALVQARWQRFVAKKLPKLGKVSSGNKLTVFYNKGDEAFDALWKSLSTARNKIYMEMYTIGNDGVGKQTLEHLASARNTGKGVFVILDGLGSVSLPQTALAALRGSAFIFNPLFKWVWAPWRLWNRVWNRTHRKLVAIDGQVGFIGGMNISEQYAGRKLGTGYFKDIQFQVEGPAVAHLENVALESLSKLAIVDPSIKVPSPPPANESLSHHEDGSPVMIFDTDLLSNKAEIQRATIAALSTATLHCYIITPYFLPPQWLKRALISAALRGVDVRIITAGRSDVPFVRLASQHIYSYFLKRGVKIYEMFGSTLHAKMFTVDGVFSCAGSFNFDLWSGLGNRETNIGTFCKDTTVQLEKEFMEELKSCKEVTLKDMKSRSYITQFVHWLAFYSTRWVSPPKLRDIYKNFQINRTQKKTKRTIKNIQNNFSS